MLNFDNCTRAQLEEVLETLAYHIAHYEHPSWFYVDEQTIFETLKNEGLDVKIEKYV